jgi:hypothetical protein
MHDVIEGHGEHESHGDNPFTIPVTVTLSILAVLLAICTLLGHRAAKEELLLQSQESDQWNFFQAKNNGARSAQISVDQFGIFTAVDQDKAAAALEKYKKEAERYSEEKAEVKKEAESLKQERRVVGQRGDRYEAAEVVLEIGLIICSFTLLTKKKVFWFGGMLLGVVGILIASSGFLIH